MDAEPPSSQLPAAEGLAAALAEGGAEEREAAYISLERAAEAGAVALVAASVKPLTDFVLCAPASRIAAAEW